MQGLQKDGLGSNGHHMGSMNSGLSRRSRTPSGKSVKSRTASRAEYHMDLKAELDQVRDLGAIQIGYETYTQFKLETRYS